jgi:hypothetical protein
MEVSIMTKAIYGVGDKVVLNEGPLRQTRRDTEFRILAVLPESGGQVQYQVRSDAEGFDRRIAAGDIDAERSGISKNQVLKPVAKADHEPWFKPSAIKIKK